MRKRKCGSLHGRCSHCRLHSGERIQCKKMFLTSLSNDVFQGDIILWKTQTVKIDARIKNKKRRDWVAVEYRGETFLKCTAQFPDQSNLLQCFRPQAGTIGPLEGKSTSVRQ